MSDTTKLPELLTCECCFADVQTIGAKLYHVGHTEFNCGGGGTPNTNVKYLQLQSKGIGTVNACGGWATKKKNLTQTWTVDPFTGNTCYSGDTGTVSYLCGDLTNCTATQKSYECGPVIPEEKEIFCTEEGFTKTRTESLINPYTIDDVANNVDTAINAFNFSNPKGTFGTVQFGTNGNKVLQWSASGGAPESRFTYLLDNQGNRNGVYKQKSRVKILKDVFLTKITELESGEITEEAIEVTKNQIIILDPPSEPGRIYFIPYCSTKYLSTNIKTSCSGGVTTKTAPPPKGPCLPDYWTGPDCKKYDTRTETMVASSSGTNTEEDQQSPCAYESYAESTSSSSYTSTKIERVGPNLPNCYESTYTQNGGCESTSSVDFISNLQGPNDCNDTLGYNALSKCTGSITDDGLTGTSTSKETYTFPDGSSESESSSSNDICCTFYYGSGCNPCDENTGTNVSENNTSDGEVTTLKESSSRITKVQIDDQTYTCNVSESQSKDTSRSYSENGYTHSGSTSKSSKKQSTFTVTFSNSGDDGSWETETSSDCNSCGSWYVTHDSDVKRTATVSIEASFQAPDVGKNSQGNPNPPKNYITYVQRVRREDDTKNPDCLSVKYISDIITHNSTSSGGEVKVTVPSVTLKSEKDVSDCLVHVSAITFEV